MRTIQLARTILFGEFASAKMLRGDPNGSFKEQLKSSLTQAKINPETRETIAANRPSWRRNSQGGNETFEITRQHEEKLRRAVRRVPTPPNTHSTV